MTKAVLVVLSGGQDSTTCLYYAKQRLGVDVHAITFDYGQRHARELEAAHRIGRMAHVVSHEVVSLGPILKSTSPLVSDAELEQYAHHSQLPGGVEKTFVPMRNQLFLTVAANRAVAIGADSIMTGVGQEDYGGYPDCRDGFISVLQEAINLGTWGSTSYSKPRLRIETPLMHKTKKETVELSLTLPGCYGALAWSHTSYDGAFPPTGKDHATLLRAKGFEEADVPDPLVLRAVARGLMQRPATPNYREPLVKAFCRRLVEEGGFG